ncbi:fibronectin type III domain-containing protein [Paenibacillus sp. sgz500958]|uniref:fibronectin type III domain-containing protein n=1 Tax=Paenibacillus sp. sgz500958 TaxID=3242475 RepID=UPI0036D43590
MKVDFTKPLLKAFTTMLSFALLTGGSLAVSMPHEASAAVGPVTVNLTETQEAFKNPLKGFRPTRFMNDAGFSNQEYGTVFKHYIKYTDLENAASDSVQKIKDWSNTAWAGIESQNKKVIPRVFIVYPNGGEYWPEGVPHGDVTTQWTSDILKNRLTAFIQKLGQAWDNDPRVAYVELGLWGNWGEHHVWPDKLADGTDRMPLSFQTALGNAAAQAFQNKKVQVRYPDTFQNYKFGFLWDSFALIDDLAGGEGIVARNSWRTQVNGGEVAYDWGQKAIQPGDSPDDTLSDPNHRNYVIDWIKKTHTTSLGWIDLYDAGNSTVSQGAALMQKEFGYRFVINQATFSGSVQPGGSMNVAFQVVNKGSAPFYYNWPVEASLLRSDRTVAWKGIFSGVDIRNWMPGDDWNSQTRQYNQAPAVQQVSGTFTVPSNLTAGTYTLALSILDPYGYKPSARFANTNYYAGGRTPLGKVGIGMDPANQTISPFDSLKPDNTLSYSLTQTPYDGGYSGGGSADTQAPSVPGNLAVSGKTSSSVSLTWLASTDNVGVTGYDIYRGSTLAGSVAATSFTDTGLSANTSYSYTVKAKDASGNVSASSSSVSATTNASGGGTLTSYEAEATNNTLTGAAAVSASASSSGGAKVGYVGNNDGTLQFNGINVSAAGTYSMTISYLSGEARSAQVRVNGGSPSTISLPSTGGWTTVGTVQTQVQLNAGNNTIHFSNPTGWAPDFDRIQISGGSAGDTQAPTAPANLSVSGKTSSSISLTWSAASDNVGVTQYVVYRNGNEAGTTAATSFTDSGLSASTAYTYTVKARDAAGNLSAASAAASATTNAGSGTSSLLLDNFDNSPAWPGTNDLGLWAGANSFVNNAGVIESGAIKLQYNNNGWFGSMVSQNIGSYSKLVIRLKGASGGEQNHIQLTIGGVTQTLAAFSGDTITTGYKDIAIDLVAKGVNRTSPGQLEMSFWHGGNSSVWIDEIRFE